MTYSLDSVITEPDLSPPRIIFYSPEGVGKTTWATTAPKPIFIPTEKGQGKLNYARFPQVQCFQDVVSAITTLLKEKHEYQTVVLDTLSRLEQLVHAEIRAANKDVKGGDIFANYGKGYKMSLPYFDRLIKGLNKLQDKGMMVIVLGHAEVKRLEPPDSSAYDTYLLNCYEKVRDMMYQWCDIMLFGNYKVFTKEEELGFNQKRTIGIGSGQRFIYTEERPTHKAKNRFDLPYQMPLDRPFPWADFLNTIGKPPPWGKQEEPEQPAESKLVAAERANGLSEEG